jgi:transposase
MVIAIVGIIFLSRLHDRSALGKPAAGWPPLEGGGTNLPQERLSMRKIKEILRLHSLGLSQRQIAISCAVGQATVSEYLKAAEVAGLKWPEIAEWGEERLTETVAPPRGKPVPRKLSPEPDYADIRHQLQTNKHVTLQLLWEEYRETHPDGYHYSRFCDLYRSWLRRQEVVLRQEHRAGEKLFVDFAGDTIPVHPAVAGENDTGADFRGGVRRQQLYLCRGHRDAGLGRLDRGAHTDLRIPGRGARDRRP